MSLVRHEGLIINYTAGATINDKRIVMFSTAGTTGDKVVSQATGAADLSIGISKVPQGTRQRVVQTGSTPPAIPVVTAAAGERLDIVHSGIAEVEYGGPVTRGQPLTSDANGKAVVAAPAAGANARIIGTAMINGADGTIGSVMVCPGYMQG
jgi:hypothetical protein